MTHNDNRGAVSGEFRNKLDGPRVPLLWIATWLPRTCLTLGLGLTHGWHRLQIAPTLSRLGLHLRQENLTGTSSIDPTDPQARRPQYLLSLPGEKPDAELEVVPGATLTPSSPLQGSGTIAT